MKSRGNRKSVHCENQVSGSLKPCERKGEDNTSKNKMPAKLRFV